VFKTTIKGLLAHKLRLFTTALAVTLGVSLMAGTMVLTDTISKTFTDLFGDVYKNTDAVVRAEAAFKGPQQSTGDQRGRVDEALVEKLRNVGGVAAVEGTIFGYTRLIAKNGDAIGNPANGAPTLGTNWSDVAALNPFTLVAGSPPRADDEVVIDRKSARDGDLAVGDTTTVLVIGPPRPVRITGIVTFGSADSPGGASVVMFPTAVAQRLVAEPGKYDSISFVGAKGVSQEQLVRNLSPALPSGVEAVTGTQVTKEAQSAMRQAMSYFNTLLLIFAVVALLVGGFMIFNTFSITVAQRTRETGLLRALGSSRHQVLMSVLLEALFVGVSASLVGLALGVMVATGLRALLHGLGLDIPMTSIVFTRTTALIATTAGVVVTLVAAFSPARKAAKVPPIAAMQADVGGSAGYGSKQRVLVGIGVLGAGVMTLLAGLFADIDSRVPVVGLGVLLVFFGVSVLGRTIALPLSRAIGAPLPRLRGVTGSLARENAMRNPKRTAASASALMIGVGLVGFITIFASSAKATMTQVLNRSFSGDFIIDSGAGLMGGLDPGLAAKLNTLSEVDVATGIRVGLAQIDGSVKTLVGADPATAFAIVDVRPLQGAPSDLGRGDIAVYREVAQQKGLKIGDVVPVVFKDSGLQQLRVSMIYDEHEPAGDYFLGIAAYEATFATQYDSQIYVKKAAGVTTAAGLAAVKAATTGYPGVSVLDQAGFKAEMAKPVNQLLALVYALLALAVLIALLGIANTLALSIYERTHELGLMRAVGMTRSQLRSTIRWESVIIALQGTVLGLVIGVFFGWALVKAMNSQGITAFSVPYTTLGAVVVLAGLAGVAAAVLPGRRAAKLDVLRAIVGD
jgi:putative ABC transport system permease protein